MLNRLIRRKNLARTSKIPGRTQQINFFLVNDAFMFADLPGYGFARVPAEVSAAWEQLIARYLEDTQELLGLILLLDARRGVTREDRVMVERLGQLGTPVLFALTKVDKLNRSGRARAEAKACSALGIEADQLLSTSARTGAGVSSLYESVEALVHTPGCGGRR